MESQKTITIYDVPTQTDEKLSVLESHATGDSIDFSRVQREETYVESSMPSILLKNIIYNCVPIEIVGGANSGSVYTNATPPGNSSALDPTKLRSIARASQTKSHKSESEYTLHVQFPVPILSFISGKGFVIRAAGDTLMVSGIMFNSNRSYVNLPYVFYTYHDTSIQNQAILGTLGIKSLVHRYKYPKIPRIANNYTHDLLHQNTDQICGGFREKRVVMRFLSNEDAIFKIRQIQQFLLSRELHYTLSVDRTLQCLSSLVLSRIDFKSRNKTSIGEGNSISQISSVEASILEILNLRAPNTSSGEFARNTIYSTGLSDLYISLISKNGDLDNIADVRKKIEAMRLRSRAAKKIEAKAIEDQSVNAWRNAVARREFQKSISELTPEEVKVVTITHARESNYTSTILGNKCPHIRLYRSVMNSRETMFDGQKWLKLKELLNVPKISPATVDELKKMTESYDAMIQCSRCKFATLCPHNFIMFEYMDSLFGSDTSEYMKFALETLASRQNLFDGSYCRICGELLQKSSVESESWANLAKSNDVEMVDQIQSLINDEVAETLNANLDLTRSFISRSTLTHAIATSISPWIRKYELKLSRVKTSTNLDVTFSLGLIIAIYTMMTIAHLIVLGAPNGSTDIIIKTIKTSGETDLKLLHTLFNGIYKLITTQRAAVIEKVIAFTPDRIKKLMTSAYSKISGLPIVVETTDVKFHTDLITDNPYFLFLRNLWRVNELLTAKTIKVPVSSEHKTSKSIIGVDVGDILEMSNFFEKAKMPPPWKTSALNGSYKRWMDYCWSVCSQFANRLITNTSALDFVNTQAITTEYTKNMKMRAELVNNRDLLSSAFSVDFRNLSHSQKFSSELDYLTPPTDLTRSFCTNGKVHEWKVYVLMSNESEREYKLSEFKTDPTPGAFKTMRCIVCGKSACNTSNLEGDDRKTSSGQLSVSISTFAKVRGMLAYYQIRCPNGSFHTFAEGKCTKCGFSTRLDGNLKDKFVAEYMPMYNTRNRKLIESKSVSIAENMRRDAAMIRPGKKSKREWKPWVSQNGPISEVASLFTQLPYNLLVNIGLITSIHYTAIVSGKSNPSNSATAADWLNQANVCIGYVGAIVISFNKFVVCATRGLHPDLMEACEKQSDTIRSLKPIDLAGFHEEQKWRRGSDKPNAYANWSVNRLCETLIDIYKRPPAVAQRFTNIMADMITESELNMSKAVVYKNIMIAAAKSALDINPSGEEIETPETDVEAKEFIKSITDDGETFGTGDIDVDNYADSRGDDDI